MPRFRYDDADDDPSDVSSLRRPSRAPGRGLAPEPFDDTALPAGASPSSYPESIHGPDPVPAWVITSGAAYDTERGVIKTGKEADVHLLERHDPAGRRSTLLAAKRY